MEGLWPILILWAVVALLGGRKKRPPAGGAQEDRPQDADEQGELLRALQELKRAEEGAAARNRPGTGAQARSQRSTGEAGARDYLSQRKHTVTQRGGTVQPAKRLDVFTPTARSDRVVRRPVRELPPDDDRSSEVEPVVVTIEGTTDYDLGAERVVEERILAAELRGHDSQQLSKAQVTRRSERPAVAIGGAQQHADWHHRIDQAALTAATPALKRPGALARYADGSMRSAIILAEILGKPRGMQ
jgi:hypothetical protein